jgi:hypothetical protein
MLFMLAGEISSRLSADTTTVSDSISLNLNVLVRSATQVCVCGGGCLAAHNTHNTTLALLAGCLGPGFRVRVTPGA